MTSDTAQQSRQDYDDLSRDPEQVVASLRAAVGQGTPWFPALLEAIRRWRVPHELAHGRHYYYLIGGEAFDWLLLAERLLDELDDLVNPDESAALVFEGRLPAGFDAEALKQAIGPTKYRAHLNFLYGITVEEALQLSVEEDVQKEVRCRAWGSDARFDETACQRIYLKRKEELLTLFREQRGLPSGDAITFTELREFTYWLFKYRLKTCDPAKVAADTRRGLTRLAQLDTLRGRAAAPTIAEVPQDFIDVVL